MPSLNLSPGRRMPAALALGLLPAALLVACGETTSGGRVYRDPLTFGQTTLPVAYQGETYEQALDLRGGTGPYGLRVVSGELPEGLKVSNQRLSGTPTEKGNYTFTLEATDANLSSKVQQYTLNVGDLPPLKITPELPRTEIRGATRIPLNIAAPRTARAARVTWELPAGASVTQVQGGPSSGLVVWKQTGQLLTVDLGFRQVPTRDERVALIHLTPSTPMTLSAQKFSFRVLDGQGKDLTPQAAPATPAARPQQGGAGQTAPAGFPAPPASQTRAPDDAEAAANAPVSGDPVPGEAAPTNPFPRPTNPGWPTPPAVTP